jgi:pre-mRNA-processing factor 39
MSIARAFKLSVITDANYSDTQLEDPDKFENWENLVRAAETLEGGLNRNSSPQAIATTRDSYDRFLAKFPLLFGYWKKYADLEFSIAGTEAAEMVRL